ncbi:Vasotocin-neurophysin VT 2 [Blattella germanica]|nr:Vasotocin-neurophysin VT 2 [Blattella germanica]
MHKETRMQLLQCARCGPAKLGHCYGPAICCGPQIGCLIATPETTRCLSEAASPSPCTTPSGAPCGSGKNAGRCAANGVCCTHESCHIDVSCHPSATDIAIGNTDQLNSFYNLYNVISSAYQQENPEGEQK